MNVVPKLLAFAGLLLLGPAHGLLLAKPSTAKKKGRSALIEKRKWSWKEASEESKTEWGIVLKRYIMVDMSLYELERHFDEAAPEVGVGTGVSVDEADIAAALAKSRKKLAKLKANLDMAVLDQNTTDTTAADMQVVR